MKIGIPHFAAALREIRTEEFVPARLNPILENLELIQSSVDRYTKWRPGGYTRNLVYANPEFELIVLCWDAGSASAVHDHAGQQCWFVAHSGVFTVENYELISGGRRPGSAHLEATDVLRGVTTGMPDYRAPEKNEIHRVSVAQDAGRAISIHVYAKPLAECLVFDPQAAICAQKRIGYDNVPHERILVA